MGCCLSSCVATFMPMLTVMLCQWGLGSRCWVVRRGWLAGLSRCPKACPNEVAPEDDVQPANYINKVTVAVSTNIETHHLPRATERETKVQTTFYVSKHHFLRTLVPNYLNKLLANFVLLCTKTKKKTLSAMFASCTCAFVS